jgi:transcriptional regulator NrdR family protein
VNDFVPATTRCTRCGSEEKSGVVDSRPWNGFVRRRRRCENCFSTWSTIEVPEALAGDLPGIVARLESLREELDRILTRMDHFRKSAEGEKTEPLCREPDCG